MFLLVGGADSCISPNVFVIGAGESAKFAVEVDVVNAGVNGAVRDADAVEAHVRVWVVTVEVFVIIALPIAVPSVEIVAGGDVIGWLVSSRRRESSLPVDLHLIREFLWINVGEFAH